MTFPWPRRIGIRIAVSHILVLIGTMVVFMAGTAWTMYWEMREQLEHYAIQDLETVEGLMYFSPEGALVVREDYHNHPESKQVLERFLEVRGPDGGVLYRDPRLGQNTLGGLPGAKEGVNGDSARTAALEDGMRVVMVSRAQIVDGHPALIRLAYSEEGIYDSLNELFKAAGLVFPLMVAFAVVIAWRMSRTVLDPIAQITSRAEQINSNLLHERLPVRDIGDELDNLAAVFNNTLARLDRSFQELRHFTADASHELRTPLAAVRSMGEVGLQRDGGREDYRELVGSMLEELNRLSQLIDQLLMISRADSGAIELRKSVVSANQLARDAVSLLQPLAEEKSQRLTFTETADARISVDPIFVRQAVINIVHNAVKYSPPQSSVAVRVAPENGSVVIEVEDSGPGIPPEHAGRIFDRFYRIDEGRSRAQGGFGLGLAIAQWAVTAHGGTIGLAKAAGGGCNFRVVLPRTNS
jgi:heavy metal sensor kinase